MAVIFDKKLNGCLVEVSILRIHYNAKLKPQAVSSQLTKTSGGSLYILALVYCYLVIQPKKTNMITWYILVYFSILDKDIIIF